MHSLASQLDAVRHLLNWRDALDILLLTGGVYFLYHTLRSQGAWKIVSGIVIVFLAFSAARLAGFRGVDWILSNLSHVALLGLIIIFQPEIRKLFERAATLRRQDTNAFTSRVRTQLSDAVFTLADQRRGAIFVLPGREAIQPWTSEGVPLDAHPSLPLIVSIFDPHSPGHDGAMVIQNGRAVSFGVRLPVSQETRLSESMGTRHHAAMELSRVTDALVVAVSEERGSVTAFHKRNMKAVRDRAELAALILAHWREDPSSFFDETQKRQRRIFFSEAGVSLVLALLFWSTVFIAQAEVRERAYTVPVDYITGGNNVAFSGNRAKDARVQLAGTKQAFDKLDPSRLAVKVDLSRALPGRHRFPITENALRLPPNVSLVEAEPPMLEFVLEARPEREVPIRPQLVGELPGGLRVGEVKVSPPKVRVLLSGGSPPGQDPPSVLTTPIFLETVRNNTKVFCKIVAPPSVRPADGRWPDVEVEIVVTRGPGG